MLNLIDTLYKKTIDKNAKIDYNTFVKIAKDEKEFSRRRIDFVFKVGMLKLVITRCGVRNKDELAKLDNWLFNVPENVCNAMKELISEDTYEKILEGTTSELERKDNEKDIGDTIAVNPDIINDKLEAEYKNMRDLLIGTGKFHDIDDLRRIIDLFKEIITKIGEQGSKHTVTFTEEVTQERTIVKIKTSDGKPAKILFFPLSANPTHWGHLLSPQNIMLLTNADVIDFRVQNHDPRKEPLADYNHRIAMLQKMVEILSPLVKIEMLPYDDGIISGEEPARQLALDNPNHEFFYVVGDDHAKFVAQKNMTNAKEVKLVTENEQEILEIKDFPNKDATEKELLRLEVLDGEGFRYAKLPTGELIILKDDYEKQVIVEERKTKKITVQGTKNEINMLTKGIKEYNPDTGKYKIEIDEISEVWRFFDLKTKQYYEISNDTIGKFDGVDNIKICFMERVLTREEFNNFFKNPDNINIQNVELYGIEDNPTKSDSATIFRTKEKFAHIPFSEIETAVNLETYPQYTLEWFENAIINSDVVWESMKDLKSFIDESNNEKLGKYIDLLLKGHPELQLKKHPDIIKPAFQNLTPKLKNAILDLDKNILGPEEKADLVWDMNYSKDRTIVFDSKEYKKTKVVKSEIENEYDIKKEECQQYGSKGFEKQDFLDTLNEIKDELKVNSDLELLSKLKEEASILKAEDSQDFRFLR